MSLKADMVDSCGQEGPRVLGDHDLAHRGEALALVLAHDGVLDLVLDRVQTHVLPALVGAQRAARSRRRSLSSSWMSLYRSEACSAWW